MAAPPAESIEPNGLASWLIVLSTKTAGVKHAEFVVDSEGGTARVPLDGEGLGENVGPDTEGTIGEISYYSCSVGASPSRAWPLAIALVFVIGRRRRRNR